MKIRFNEIFRLSLPAILLIFFIFLSCLYTSNEFIIRFLPSFEIAGIFYFGIYREEVIPKWLLVSIGLLKDLLTGLPLGTYPIIFLSLLFLIISNRRLFIREPFISVWIGFAIYYITFLIIKIAVFLVITKNLWISTDLIWEWSVASSFFVLLYLIFNRIYAILPLRV